MYKIFGKHAIDAIKNNKKRKGVQLQSNHVLTREIIIESSLEEILDNSSKILIIDNATDVRNVGAIIRSAAILQFAVLLRTRCCVNEMSVECASGGTEHTPIAFIKDLQNTINRIKEKGFWLVGLNENGRIQVPSFDKAALVVGSEGFGISQLMLKNCDYLWQLESKGSFNIYNASNSAAIAMYLLR